MEQFKTWTDLKSKLNYKSENEKKEIALKAKLVNALVNKRKEKGIEISDWADIAKVNTVVIAEMEDSEYVPSFDFLIKLAVALDAKIEIH
ncbi:helix-turn-helix transcriptional regulator [Paenibacillus polymyxa]|uniref:helix-turn-helix transcriptional regulator n=1 Tax=Paenibacillus polymyxa TaxID=1406 RepID=UPI00287F9CE8|nr:helix-turn-helix transcriptional regulator [Paenibacillus polymyxa]